MADFQILSSDFAATEVVVRCASEAAKQRLGGAVSFTVRKSDLPACCAKITGEGFEWELA
jgi:hypothetical protein